MSKKHKILLTVLVVGLAGVLAGFGVFAAFSSTTSNTDNTFAAGSIALTDNDGGTTALFDTAVDGPLMPGDYDRCIRVSYGSSIDATVKLYTSAITGTGNDVDVTVDQSATGDAMDCSDFGTSTNVFAAAPLSTLDNSADWSTGITVNPGVATKWVDGDSVTFRFRITVGEDDGGKTVDPFDVTWEAQNQ